MHQKNPAQGIALQRPIPLNQQATTRRQADSEGLAGFELPTLGNKGVAQGLEIGADPGPALLKSRECQGGLLQATTFLPTPMLRSSVSRPLSTALASPNTIAVWGSSNRAFLMPA
jgi:hypothetical protein